MNVEFLRIIFYAKDRHMVHIVVCYRNHMCVNRIFNFVPNQMEFSTTIVFKKTLKSRGNEMKSQPKL